MGREEILQKAREAVTKRNLEYGEPENSFGAIAELWLAWLKIRKNEDLRPVDVPIMMMLFKIGRLAGNGGHLDTWIDIAGYAACGGQLVTEPIKEMGK